VSAILKLALTIFAALAGARLFERIHAPAPMVSGSIIGVTACTLLFPGWTFFPAELKTFVQICSGATIGSRVSRRNIREMRYLLISAVALIASLLAFNIVCAIGLFHTGIRSIPTAMFSSAPGGISDMAIMAPDFGADPVYVAVIQLCRLLFINSVFPVLIQFVVRHKLYPGAERPVAVRKTDVQSAGLTAAPFPLTAVLALTGGMLFKYLGVPAGAILGAAFFVALENVKYEKIALPGPFKYAVQLGIGCYVGVQMTRSSLLILRAVIPPVLLLLLASLVYTYLCALLICSVSHMDFATSMLMCAPGGLSEMAIIADEMGADTPKVAVMHSIRLICIVAFFNRIIPVLEWILS
jgi:membrane AbrB-like protein